MLSPLVAPELVSSAEAAMQILIAHWKSLLACLLVGAIVRWLQSHDATGSVWPQERRFLGVPNAQLPRATLFVVFARMCSKSGGKSTTFCEPVADLVTSQPGNQLTSSSAPSGSWTSAASFGHTIRGCRDLGTDLRTEPGGPLTKGRPSIP